MLPVKMALGVVTRQRCRELYQPVLLAGLGAIGQISEVVDCEDHTRITIQGRLGTAIMELKFSDDDIAADEGYSIGDISEAKPVVFTLKTCRKMVKELVDAYFKSAVDVALLRRE